MWGLDCEEGWALKNWCFWTVVLEKTLESPLDWKEISPRISLEGMKLKLKLQFFGHLWPPLATFGHLWPPLVNQELTHWKRLWCWEGLGAGVEGDDRGWDGWMISPIQWTWVWVNSGSWWWTGRPGVLRFMRSQRVGHDWVTQLNWTELFLGSKVMTNLDSIFKSRDIILPTKVHLVKAMVFPVVMYGCESWTVKKAERQRIDDFELWCWRRVLRVS